MKKQQKHQKWFHLNYGIFIPFRRESVSKEKGEYLEKNRFPQLTSEYFSWYLIISSSNKV